MNIDVLHDQDYLIKQLPQATAFLNTNLEFTHISNSWLENFEVKANSIIGKNLNELSFNICEKGIQQIENYISGTTNNKSILLWDNHTEKWYEWFCSPWFNEENDIIGLIIQGQNASEKTISDQKVVKLESLLNELTALTKIGLWEYHIDKDELYWSSQSKKIYEVDEDYKPEIESSFDFYKHGHNRNSMSMAIFKATTVGKSWKEKLEVITAKGKSLWVTSTGKAIYENGKIVSLIGTTQDITEQVIAQTKIAKSEQLLRTVIDNLPLNLYIKDLESRKTLVNKSEIEYYGFDNENELLGTNDFDLLDKQSAQMCRKQDLYVIKSLKPVLDEENTVYRKDGGRTTFLTSKIPLLDTMGVATGLMGFSLDISNLKEKETELRDLINITSLQNKKLVNFAHIVSHNLRSHSANFSMLLEFLKGEKDKNEKKRIENMLIKASNDLLETLDNLNDVVTINTTQVKINKKTININSKINEIEKKLAVHIRKHNVTIENTIPPSATLATVPEYFENMLINFFTNAMKYKFPDRAPIIKTYIKKTKNGLILSIEDNGVGIDLEKCGDKLFGLYKTFHNNEDARGLSLYISKNQIEAMNGEITVESKVGVGTTFNIHFNEKN